MKHNDHFDPTEPALIVMHGNTAHKHLPLQRTATTLGRARGCDIDLETPDVSGVHCVITRGPDGTHIRDCASRCGTKVNGEKIRESPLRNGDVIQVGTFSFEVSLPFIAQPTMVQPKREPASPPPSKSLRRYARSRARLVKLALSLRRKLRTAAPSSPSQEEELALVERRAELDSLTESLHARAAACDQANAQLQKSERTLAERKVELERQAQNLQTQRHTQELQARHFDERERALTARRAEFDLEMEAMRECLVAQEQDRVQLEAALRQFAAEQAEALEHLSARRSELELVRQELEQRQIDLQHSEAEISQQPVQPALPLSAEEIRCLEIRNQDLICLSRHLQSSHQRLHEQEEQINNTRSRLDHEAQDLQLAHNLLAVAKQELDRDRETIVQAEASMHEQRAELDLAVYDVQRLHATLQQRENAEMEDLRKTNERLQRIWMKVDVQEPTVEPTPAATVEPTPAVNEQQLAEWAQLREQLEKTTELQQAALSKLRQQLEEKDALLVKLRDETQPVVACDSADIERYESELNEYRRQLAAERQAFDAEVRQFGIRNGEMKDSARGNEIELSRERARLSQERIYLERLRDEVRDLLERSHRDDNLRDRLAHLQRPRSMLSDAPSVSDTPAPPLVAPPEKGGGRLINRLHSLLNRF